MILIAGGAGFIGSNLSERLSIEGLRNISIDNFSTGTKRKGVIYNDIENPVKLNLKKGDIKCIVNLASPASPISYQKDKLKTLKTNFMGTLNLLELSKYHNASFIQASTSEVYGDPSVTPQNENYNGNVSLSGPRACYDEGKRSAEVLVKEFGIGKYQVLRIFNTYGPGMLANDGRVVSNFINQALKGNDLTIYGTGNQTRSFCYISDLIDLFIKIIKEDKFFNCVVNAGNDNEISIKNIADKVIRISNSKSAISYSDLPKDDPTNRRPCLNKVKKMFDWAPSVSIDEGLTKTIEYFKKR